MKSNGNMNAVGILLKYLLFPVLSSIRNYERKGIDMPQAERIDEIRRKIEKRLKKDPEEPKKFLGDTKKDPEKIRNIASKGE